MNTLRKKKNKRNLSKNDKKSVCCFFKQKSFQIFKLTLFFFSLLLLSKAIILSQQENLIVYKVMGRVLDKNGKPISGSGIVIFPKTDFCHTFEREWTDNNGQFEETVLAQKGETYYLYVSDVTEEAVNHKSLISTPFQCSNINREKFLGKPIKFGDEALIDVGDVNVQFWFGAVYPKLTIKGKRLTKKQWLQIWIRLIDEEGRVVAEESVAPTVKSNEIDIKKSLLKLSLPEGKWKLEFQRFNYDEIKIYPEIIGETPYFEIDTNETPQVIKAEIIL